MSDYKFIEVDRSRKNVLKMVLNRPEIHNAFHDEMIAEISKLFVSIENDLEIRVVAIEGKGRSFCAGADLNWMKKMKEYSEALNYQDSLRLAKMFQLINECPFPVIAKVGGAALGGGVGLLATCDYVVASESSLFGLTEVRLGLLPAVISPYVISKIGESMARAYMTSGIKFDAIKALNMHLIHEVVEPQKLDASFDKLVGRFLKAAPEASKKAKILVRSVLDLGRNRASLQEMTCEKIAKIRTSEEAQGGMSALLSKELAPWLKD